MKSIKRFASTILILILLLAAIMLVLPAINSTNRGPRPLSREVAAKMHLQMAGSCLKEGDEQAGLATLKELVDEASDLPEGQEAKAILAKQKPRKQSSPN